jgi:hypothetical protein
MGPCGLGQTHTSFSTLEIFKKTKRLNNKKDRSLLPYYLCKADLLFFDLS